MTPRHAGWRSSEERRRRRQDDRAQPALGEDDVSARLPDQEALWRLPKARPKGKRGYPEDEPLPDEEGVVPPPGV